MYRFMQNQKKREAIPSAPQATGLEEDLTSRQAPQQLRALPLAACPAFAMAQL